MPMTSADVVELVTDHLAEPFRAEQERLDVIDRWYRWNHEDITVPREATREHRALVELSKTPWLGLVVTGVAQSLRIDGYRTPESREDSPGWRMFQANQLRRRQGAVHRAAIAYGASYGLGLPGVDDLTGEPLARLRGVSPRKMLAFYADPAEDDLPLYALRLMGGGAWKLYDAEAVYDLVTETTPSGQVKLVSAGWSEHPAGVCPVVRFTNQLDLDGRTDGEVEPFIPLAKRIDKTTYDRLLIQHFNSWKVRTIAGMAAPEAEEDAAREKIRLRQEDLLVSEDFETKFGTLPETSLDPILKAYEADIRSLAAASQTPTHALTGDLINLSAEALAAARAELDAKVEERQDSFGATWAQWLRLGAHVVGDEDAAADVLAEVTWADTSVRSLAQTADALGKVATMLGVPPRALWRMLPGVTSTDVEDWKRIAEEDDALGQLTTLLENQQAPSA